MWHLLVDEALAARSDDTATNPASVLQKGVSLSCSHDAALSKPPDAGASSFIANTRDMVSSEQRNSICASNNDNIADTLSLPKPGVTPGKCHTRTHEPRKGVLIRTQTTRTLPNPKDAAADFLFAMSDLRFPGLSPRPPHSIHPQPPTIDIIKPSGILNQMVVDKSTKLDLVFHALAHPARRAIIRQLSGGERNLSELASPLKMTFPAATKHVRVLERAKLVRRRIVGRQHLCRLHAAPLKEATLWTEQFRQYWEARFEILDSLLDEMKSEDQSRSRRR